MTNRELFMYARRVKGLSMAELAKIGGMSRAALYNKVGNIREFKASEIDSIAKALDLTAEDKDRIFFAA